jgi:hypothetical protein
MDGCGLSRESNCRTEQKVEFIKEDTYGSMLDEPSWGLFSDRVATVSFNIERRHNDRTSLKKQVDMGARNY